MCQKLLVVGAFPFELHEQVRGGIEYLAILHKQCDEPQVAVEPEVASHPKETSLELVNATN